MASHPIHVCNIIEEGRLGGPQVRIAAVAKHIKKHGVETTVVLPLQDNQAFVALLDSHGIAYKALGIHRLSKQAGALTRYVLTFGLEILSLAAHFRKEKYDIIHCSGGVWQIKGLIAAKLASTPAVWHLNDTGTPLPFHIAFRILSRVFPTALIVAAQRVRQYYLGENTVPRLPVHEVQAPVDTQKYTPGSVAACDTMSAYDGLKVLTCGSVNPAKGLETFIRLAAIASKSRSDLQFFILGPAHPSQAAYKQRLDELIAELGLRNIHFLGFRADVRPALEAADIYVCASDLEASPLSVWEAMSMAKPIVSTDVGDVARFLVGGKAGLVVPTKDAKGLAEHVLRLANHPESRREMGAAARKTAQQRLDISTVAKTQAIVYHSIINLSFKDGNKA